MLDYIVPPIIIVISSAILIVFLFKKFSREGTSNPEVVRTLNGEVSGPGITNKFFSFLSHLWLRILERMMQRLKLLSLKMHNVSNDWFHSIKSKREEKSKISSERLQEEKVEEGLGQEVIVEKPSYRRGVDLAKKPTEASVGKEKILGMLKSENERLKKIREDISKRKMFFRKQEIKEEKVVEKSSMEEDLIKRIAINPKDIEAYERLGDYYADLKNLRDAIECYRQVLKLSPDSEGIRIKMKNLESVLRK